MRRRQGGYFGLAVAAAVLLAVTVVLGVVNPVRQMPVSTDALGPDNGERVSDYLARSSRSLAVEPRSEHWALVSFEAPVTTEVVGNSPPVCACRRFCSVFPSTGCRRPSSPYPSQRVMLPSPERASWLRAAPR